MRHLRPILTGTLLVLAASVGAARAEDAPAATDPAIAKVTKPHHVYLVGQLRVMQPWIDVAGSADDKARAYLVVENRGAAPERLTAARTEGADHVAFEGRDEGAAASGGGIAIPPHATVALKPDDAHLVLEGLHGDVRGRSTVAGVLQFERAGPLQVQFATTRDDALRQDQTDPSTDDPASLIK